MTNRIRYIRPDFFLDEGAAALPDAVQLFLIGLGTHADREGRLEDRPRKLKAQIRPYDAAFDPEEALNILATKKRSDGRPFIIRFASNDDRFIQIVGWDKEQRPHPSEKASEIPPTPDNVAVDVKEQPHNNRADVKERLRVDGDGDFNGDGDGDRDGEGDRGGGDQNAPPAPSRGSDSASPDGLAEPCLSSNPPLISESTIRGFLKIKSKSEVLELLRKGGYPIPEFLLGEPAGEPATSPADPPEKEGQGHAEE